MGDDSISKNKSVKSLNHFRYYKVTAAYENDIVGSGAAFGKEQGLPHIGNNFPGKSGRFTLRRKVGSGKGARQVGLREIIQGVARQQGQYAQQVFADYYAKNYVQAVVRRFRQLFQAML